jgi:hypothetical protein
VSKTQPGSEFGPLPLTHSPFKQTSWSVQAFWSLHTVPSAALEWVQPSAVSQVSTVQALASSQLGAGPPTQRPLAQASAVVHASRSLQAVPFDLNPSAGQVPDVPVQLSAGSH